MTREDAAALLEVIIRDYRIHHEDLAGELMFGDNGAELVWKAINAAHRMLKPA